MKLSFRISQLPPKLRFLSNCSFFFQPFALSSVIQAAERGLFTNYLTLESANMLLSDSLLFYVETLYRKETIVDCIERCLKRGECFLSTLPTTLLAFFAIHSKLFLYVTILLLCIDLYVYVVV